MGPTTPRDTMKILTGQFRGRNISMPPDIRPTQNVVRKATFDLIGHDLGGMTFLDLYAGSGAVGIEALSLGASKVTFVERDPASLVALEANLRLIGGISSSHLKKDSYEIIVGDSLATIKKLSQEGRCFDIVFLDPPYDQGRVKKTLKTLLAYDILQLVSLLIVQHSHSESLPDLQERFSLIRHRKYGKSFLAIFERNPLQPSVGEDDRTE